MKTIPKRFYKHGQHPVAENVGQLIKLLSELPDDLRVEDGWGGSPEVVVFNHGQQSMHLQLHEKDES